MLTPVPCCAALCCAVLPGGSLSDYVSEIASGAKGTELCVSEDMACFLLRVSAPRLLRTTLVMQVARNAALKREWGSNRSCSPKD